LRFALPITTGTKPGVADYLPAPHGLPGFAAPVEQIYPALASFIELEDGRTIVATDGADVIDPSADGQSLRLRWNRWAVRGRQPGELVDVGVACEVVWRIERDTLTREETITAKQPVNIRRWWLTVPSTYANVETVFDHNTRVDRFTSTKGGLEVRMLAANFPMTIRILATGDGPLGRGVQGAIPLHLVFDSNNLGALQPGKPLHSKLALTVSSESNSVASRLIN
jgi:hypothetical protein